MLLRCCGLKVKHQFGIFRIGDCGDLFSSKDEVHHRANCFIQSRMHLGEYHFQFIYLFISQLQTLLAKPAFVAHENVVVNHCRPAVVVAIWLSNLLSCFRWWIRVN